MPRAQGYAGAAIAHLVALVPKPRVHLTRFHGVFAPHSKYRARVTPAKRGQGRKIKPLDETPDQTPAERRTWPIQDGTLGVEFPFIPSSTNLARNSANGAML